MAATYSVFGNKSSEGEFVLSNPLEEMERTPALVIYKQIDNKFNYYE